MCTCQGSCESQYLKPILFALQCRQVEPTHIDSTIVWVDNFANLVVVDANDFIYETVKHVTVKIRFLQSCVQHNLKVLLLSLTSTLQNITDLFGE